MIHKEKIYLTYPNAKIVGECVRTMLQGEQPFPACPTIFIGYNGKEFVSSSDWEIETPNGTCVLPFGILPQYPTFIQVYAGMNYYPHPSGSPLISPNPTDQQRNAIVRLPDGQEFEFLPGEPLKLAAKGKIAQRFPLTDCRVCVGTLRNKVIYSVVADENTSFGKYDGENIEQI